MPAKTFSLAPGIARAVASPPLERDQRVLGPVQHECRQLEPPQPRSAVGGGGDRVQLAGDSLRVVAAVKAGSPRRAVAPRPAG